MREREERKRKIGYKKLIICFLIGPGIIKFLNKKGFDDHTITDLNIFKKKSTDEIRRKRERGRENTKRKEGESVRV